MKELYEAESGNLTVRTSIPLMRIFDFEIVHEKNQHGKLRIHGSILYGDREKAAGTGWSDDPVWVCKKGNEKDPLFHGIIEEVVIREEGQTVSVEIYGVSGSRKLDRVKKRNVFQNPNMTYNQVVHEILDEHKQANVIWQTEEERKIGTPIIQYDETDWEFLKRLCSHFHNILISDLKTGHTNFFFGMKLGNERDMEHARIRGKGFGGFFYSEGCYEHGMDRNQAFYIDMETDELWQMGDLAWYEGRRFRVFQRRILYKNGELRYFYRLGEKGAYFQRKQYNPSIAGLSLEGTVKRTERESVFLEMDVERKKRPVYPWSWKPETNSLSYCMPEIGMKAAVYFPTEEEGEGIAVFSMRQKDGSGEFQPQNREFATKWNKRIGMYPGKMFLDSSRDLVEMADLTGIRIESGRRVRLSAGGNISISARKVLVESPVEVVCSTEESNIEICRDFNFYAPLGVKTIGSGNDSERNSHTPKKGGSDAKRDGGWQAAFASMAAVPKVDLGKMRGAEDIIDLVACGGVPQVAGIRAAVSLSEVMDGREESQCTFPNAFKSMENLVIKGGRPLVGKKTVL